jgi:hypothetical protein
MQEQIPIFYDPKTTGYCTNEQDRQVLNPTVLKDMMDKLSTTALLDK